MVRPFKLRDSKGNAILVPRRYSVFTAIKAVLIFFIRHFVDRLGLGYVQYRIDIHSSTYEDKCSILLIDIARTQPCREHRLGHVFPDNLCPVTLSRR